MGALSVRFGEQLMKAFGSWATFTARSTARLNHRKVCAAGAALAFLGACLVVNPSAASTNEGEALIGVRIEATDPGCVIGAFDHRLIRHTSGVGTYRGARTVRHGGRGNIGFLRFSDIGGAVAVLCARDEVDAESIAERVAELVFTDRLAPLRPVARVEDNRDLVGEYVAESGRQLTIIEDKGTLVLSDWGPIRTLEDGGLTASPTDELLLRRTDSGLQAQYSSGRPVDFGRVVLGMPARTEPGMLSGIDAHPQLPAILRIEEGDGSAVMTFAGNRRVELERLTPGLFTAGRFRSRAVEATGKPASGILLRTWRTPELTFSRLATP
jgi:hypothetical protein